MQSSGTAVMLWFIVIAVAVTVVVFMVTAFQFRRHADQTDRRPCRYCGAVFPARAKFCGRCGRPL